MRPYGTNGAANGTTPAKAGKKSKAAGNGVKKTLVKAKVNAVKTTRRIASRGDLKGEVDNLLELSVASTPAKGAKQKNGAKSPARGKRALNGANGSANGNANGSANANGVKKVVSSANLKKQLQKLQKQASSNGSANGNGSVESPRRRSSRNVARNTIAVALASSSPKPKKMVASKLDLSIDSATEATEDAVDGPASRPGFLKKTVSKIWGTVPYAGLDDQGRMEDDASEAEQRAKAKAKEAAESEGQSSRSSCVIS